MADQRQVLELSTILSKIQGTFGTPETSLISTDFCATNKAVQIPLEPVMTAVELVGGGFSNTKSVVGPYAVAYKESQFLKNPVGATQPGRWAQLLKCCGFLESVVGSVYTYTPSDKFSEWKDMTVWGYSGNLDTNQSLLAKVGNVMGTGKFSLDFDKGVATFDFDGKGLFTGDLITATQPTVTRSTTIQAPIKNATVSIMGVSTYTPQGTFEVDIGNDTQTTIDPTSASGLGRTMVTKRKAKSTLKVYQNSGATPPTTAMLAGTTAAISVQWGSAPQKFTINLTLCQIEKATPGDANGYQTFDLSLLVENNGMSIATDVTGS